MNAVCPPIRISCNINIVHLANVQSKVYMKNWTEDPNQNHDHDGYDDDDGDHFISYCMQHMIKLMKKTLRIFLWILIPVVSGVSFRASINNIVVRKGVMVNE